MSLQLILGGAGSGKTTCLYDRVIENSIRHPEQKIFMIVPEQFTMQTQKDIVSRHPRHSTMNIDIVSFQRLAYRIFEETAIETLTVLDDMGKSMVLRKVVSLCRKDLVFYRRHLGQTGFIGRLKTTISEFYQYGITPEDLERMAPEAANPLLKQKLIEFAGIFRTFRDYIDGHYITTEEILDVLCRVLPQSELISESVIALDGFAGFMPVQYRLLELFMIHSRQVIVTVTADRSVPVDRPLGMQNLFAMSSEIVCRLLKSAKKNRIPLLPDIWLTSDGHRAAELEFLERNLFRYQRREYRGEATGGIEFNQAVNPADEVAGLVHRIQILVKEQGYRYRDIAVVTGDLAGYGRELQHQFEQNNIPCFLDDKKTMLDHPLVELIRAALEIMYRDFSYESVFRYLRCGLTAEDGEMTDRAENYVLALGIRGRKRWNETWNRTYRGGEHCNLEELNTWKDAVTAPLFALQEAFDDPERTVGTLAGAVTRLLEDLNAEKKLGDFQQYFEKRGELRLASEYGQIYGVVSELLNRLAELLGEEKTEKREFAEILDAGFGEISVGVIPATVDRVVMGDIMRTRLAHVRALFFIGINDGIVPSRNEGGSLFTDQEREFFGAHEMELAPTAREDSFRQRFFLYRMMGKPTEKLILSYCAVGADGKSRRASYLIGDLQRMFPNARVSVCTLTENNTERAEVYSPEEARRMLAEGLREYRENRKMTILPAKTGPDRDNRSMRDELPVLVRWFQSAPDTRAEFRRLEDAAFGSHEKRGIGRAAAQALYGKVIYGSVTRLEQYASCAYAHFLQYGLELTERTRFEIRAADLGNLFHDSIERCFQKAGEEGLDWQTLTDENRTELVHGVVKQVTEEYDNRILASSSRNEFLARRVETITQRTVWALQKQLQKGDFTPVGFEVTFSAGDQLEAMRIPLSQEEELRLRGRIDRLDLCETPECVYVKIIDYKSGSTTFDLQALYYGLQLQLVVYMDAVMEMTGRRFRGREIVPAGIFYYNISDPVVAKETIAPDLDGQYDRSEIEREILRQLKMNGLVNSELEVIRHMDRSIETASDVIPVVLKNEAVVEGKSSVASRERMERLKKYVREKVKESGRGILSGEIEAAPVKQGARTACDFCPYHAVCGFDRKNPGYEFKTLRKMKPERIWEEICR
ncbi:MAG: helicase-exonuclease AddAB subunit AddB [Clostridiales bacterium]|nr:helicase-exonuclease AddAB subunit AddB [Clostridiales bacterium]